MRLIYGDEAINAIDDHIRPIGYKEFVLVPSIQQSLREVKLGEDSMDKLNNAIANTAYIIDCLRSLRAIYETGDCNNCGIEAMCKVKPMPGQMVRYNCPFYKKDGE